MNRQAVVCPGAGLKADVFVVNMLKSRRIVDGLQLEVTYFHVCCLASGVTLKETAKRKGKLLGILFDDSDETMATGARQLFHC